MDFKIPFLTLSYQHVQIKKEIFRKWEELYDRTEFVYNKTGKEFEKLFAEFNDCKFALAVDTGTSAVEISLRAIGIKPGDEIITVANTFIATVAAIHFVGAKPVFVEVDEDTWNIDPDKIEEAITEKTKAIMPVHLYGQPANMEKIRQIADKYNLLVVADSSQAIGSRIEINGIWKNPNEFADISAFSFYPGKNLGACGEAGAITTNNANYAEFVAMFRDHGSKIKYIHEIVGKNNRIDALQAAALIIKLKYINKWNKQRQQIAEWYQKELLQIDEIKIQHTPANILSNYHLFVILVKNREEFQKFLAAKGIGTGIHYKLPIHFQKAFSYLNLNKGSLPITESIVERNVSLPMYPELEYEQVKYIVEVIKKFLMKY